MKNEQLEKLIMEKNAAMTYMSTCLLQMEKRVALNKSEKGRLSKSHTELFASAIRNETKSVCARNGFF